ncbi:MAG: bifunctional riboflavin kinase/FAD synthetase [Verrucomicrobia bacterium]|nr:bifunctional riboflavin kinase/FAD synthetase [Verrucomicrobiota bacterium]
MKTIRHPAELGETPRKVCVAIGVFDGVHLGHQQVIRQTITDARQHHAIPVVITFDRHPNSVVAPERTPPLIYSLAQKLRVIGSLGVEATLLITFDRSFSEQTGEKFVRNLARDFHHIHSIGVGSNFTFGHKRSGNVALLKTLGQELKFAVHGLAAVSLDGKIVSSTRIREAIRNGNLDAASQMLGRAYSASGIVARGDQLGRQIGFPTANLDVAGLVLPPNGVYAVHTRVGDESRPSVLNIGYRPTLKNPEPELRFEVHVLDFSGELYGQEIEITFVEKLRDEKPFPSLDALQHQIQRDVSAAQAIFGL